MTFRSFFFVLLVLFSVSNVSANYKLIEEPTIRVLLSSNARSVAVTTSDSQIVSVSPDEQPRYLPVSKLTISARAYRPPVFERFYFEIPAITTKEEADQIAKDVKETLNESVTVNLDAKTNTYRVRITEAKESLEEANEYKQFLSEKGFEDTEIITEKYEQPSNEAIALSKQINTNSNSQVRSLILTNPANTTVNTNTVQPTTDIVNPNLKEVIVSGGSSASFSSFKPVTISSSNERNIPIRFNGKSYRGKLEMFVNGKGSLSVINVVKLEDYVRGVVPNELGLPSLEAQKAQAVAARTYAVSKIGQFANEGFDVFPTTMSQVYKGSNSETAMGNQAVTETKGVLALYQNKPIRAMYTSTCGGRTEDVKNIYTDYDAPYLKGVECAIGEPKYFEPLLIKSSREPAKIKDEKYLELVRIMSQFASNNFAFTANRFSDDWFEQSPTNAELTSWLGQVALKFGKPMPQITNDSAKNIEFAKFLASILYTQEITDVLMTEADVNYQLSFNDVGDIPQNMRQNMAMLFRDGWLSLYPDATFRPNQAMSRNRLIRLIHSIYSKKKWLPTLQSGVTKSTVDGKLVLRNAKSERQLIVNSGVFLFRQFGDTLYQVKETALIGGETVNYQTNFAGEVIYLEVKPSSTTAIPERTSQFTLWNTSLSASNAQTKLARYVKGFGTLYDVIVTKKGFSRRAIEIEIVGSNGRFKLAGGKIRSAFRLKEQLFVLNKRYDANGRVASYNFTGRGLGHGVGMCQMGAFGLARQGYKYDRILKHYYSGIDLPRSY
ncbi:MAG: SpoIID/LytB domain-containing protein [Pyrinomonadaceae bacterium]|nr:SpoIID/LytB domain-containing protein [Pyrinomonadaceae bacterium]